MMLFGKFSSHCKVGQTCSSVPRKAAKAGPVLWCAPSHYPPKLASSLISQVSPVAPALLHLTPAAQNSLYTSFTQLSSWLHQLRLFTSLVLSSATRISDGPPLCQTVEAFAESIQAQLDKMDGWLAQEEEKMLRSHLQEGRGTVFSLLSLEKKIRDDFASSFEELVCILDRAFPDSTWLNIYTELLQVRHLSVCEPSLRI